MAACCKHFPGDGVEELDQHLVMGVNTFSCEEWDATFGKVYKTLIDDGIRSKIAQITEDGQAKLQDSMQKIVNDSRGGMVCIII